MVHTIEQSDAKMQKTSYDEEMKRIERFLGFITLKKIKEILEEEEKQILHDRQQLNMATEYSFTAKEKYEKLKQTI